MSATAAMRSELRRMVNEPTTATYDDNALDVYIERYPIIDAEGHEPSDDDWTATYSLYAAAADIVREKMAGVVHKTDFQADGMSASLSQQERGYRQLIEQFRAEADRQLARLPG